MRQICLLVLRAVLFSGLLTWSVDNNLSSPKRWFANVNMTSIVT